MSYRTLSKIAACLLAAESLIFATTDELFGQTQTSAELYRDCGEELGFPGAIATCLIEKDKEIGEQLTAVYNRLMSCLAEPQSQTLRASQRAWLTYQEKNCQLHETISEYEGRGIARVSYATCFVDRTLMRLAELRQLQTQSCSD